MRENKAQSAVATVYYRFGNNRISANEEAVHRIGGQRVLRAADLVKETLPHGVGRNIHEEPRTPVTVTRLADKS